MKEDRTIAFLSNGKRASPRKCPLSLGLTIHLVTHSFGRAFFRRRSIYHRPLCHCLIFGCLITLEIMYLLIVFLPLLGSSVAGFFGRFLGSEGTAIMTTTCVSFSSILSNVLSIYNYKVKALCWRLRGKLHQGIKGKMLMGWFYIITLLTYHSIDMSSLLIWKWFPGFRYLSHFCNNLQNNA